MLWLLLRDLLCFAAALIGLGAPWLPLLRAWSPGERLGLAAGAALLSGWLAGFTIHAAGLPLAWFWCAPAAGLGFTLLRPAAVRALGREPAARGALVRFGLLAAWTLGWQALVSSYSGASWQGDWLEHFDRAHFFLARWPADFLFLDLYLLPARPPLVNLWSALLLSASGGAFFHHQIFMTLLSCLIVLPLEMLVARRNPHPGARWTLLLLLMVCPMVVQNATFPWTKLSAAFFVLLAWNELTAPRQGGRLFAAALALAGGMLAHYSTGVWIAALGLAWTAGNFARLQDRSTWREITLALTGASLVLAFWLVWALGEYGPGVVFTHNTSVGLAPVDGLGARVLSALGNLLHTLLPVSLVGLDHPLLAQESTWGRFRDGWFILYQLRLWWAPGLIGGVVLVWTLRGERSSATQRFAWIALVAATVLNAIAHAQPDLLGLTHICLQPMVLLGLVWIAGNADRLPAWLGRLYAIGLGLDLLMGIGLHFALQSRLFNDTKPAFTLAAQINWENKAILGLRFLADEVPPAPAIALLGASAALAIFLWNRHWKPGPVARPAEN